MTTIFWKCNVSKIECLGPSPDSLLLIPYWSQQSILLCPETLDLSLTLYFLSHSASNPIANTLIHAPHPVSLLFFEHAEHPPSQICSLPSPSGRILLSCVPTWCISNPTQVSVSENLSLMTLSYPITFYLLYFYLSP